MVGVSCCSTNKASLCNDECQPETQYDTMYDTNYTANQALWQTGHMSDEISLGLNQTKGALNMQI